jgi:glycosyltransferase involved in cell wall biosynthesis
MTGLKKISNMKKTMKHNKPLVSVIIPVFNGATYLIEAVNSVVKSTYKNIEVLLVDDGSKDTSTQLCHMLEKKYKNVHFYSFKKNKGLGRTLNFAIKKAKGTYICRLNQDDVMKSERIATQVAYFESHPEVVACGSWINMFEDKKNQTIKFLETDEQIKKIWLIISPFADPSVMYRKTAVIRAGLYKQEFWPGDDTHLWYRLGMIGKLANIQKVLVNVRYHEGAASVKYFRNLNDATFRMHRWAHKNVQKASLGIQLFWIIQYVLGALFSANFNWKAYRIMKGCLNFFTKKKAKKTIKKVAIQPRMFSFSGK